MFSVISDKLLKLAYEKKGNLVDYVTEKIGDSLPSGLAGSWVLEVSRNLWSVPVASPQTAFLLMAPAASSSPRHPSCSFTAPVTVTKPIFCVCSGPSTCPCSLSSWSGGCLHFGLWVKFPFMKLRERPAPLNLMHWQWEKAVSPRPGWGF